MSLDVKDTNSFWSFIIILLRPYQHQHSQTNNRRLRRPLPNLSIKRKRLDPDNQVHERALGHLHSDPRLVHGLENDNPSLPAHPQIPEPKRPAITQQ